MTLSTQLFMPCLNFIIDICLHWTSIFFSRQMRYMKYILQESFEFVMTLNFKENKPCCKLMREIHKYILYINKFLDVLGIDHLDIHLPLRGE